MSIEKLPKLLRHASQLVEFCTGSYSADIQADVSEVLLMAIGFVIFLIAPCTPFVSLNILVRLLRSASQLWSVCLLALLI